jgi:hypothetical protein
VVNTSRSWGADRFHLVHLRIGKMDVPVAERFDVLAACARRV